MTIPGRVRSFILIYYFNQGPAIASNPTSSAKFAAPSLLLVLSSTLRSSVSTRSLRSWFCIVETPVAAYAVRAGFCQERFAARLRRIVELVPKILPPLGIGEALATWVALDGVLAPVVQALTGEHKAPIGPFTRRGRVMRNMLALFGAALLTVV